MPSVGLPIVLALYMAVLGRVHTPRRQAASGPGPTEGRVLETSETQLSDEKLTPREGQVRISAKKGVE